MSMQNNRKVLLCVMIVLCLCWFAMAAESQVSVEPSGKENILKIGGLVQAQADFGEKGDGRFTTGNDRFYLRRARLNATGKFLEEFDFKIEVDLSANLGNNPQIVSSLRAQMTDAYINWNKDPRANIRGGQFKTGYGFEQMYSDPKLFTIERSLPNDRLTLGRQIGAQVYGDFLDKRLSYATGIFNGNGPNTTANDNDSFLVTGRFSAIPFQRKNPKDTFWSAGVNFFHSKDQDLTQPSDLGLPAVSFTGTRFGGGLDSQFRFGRLELWTEYLRQTLEPENSPTFKDFTADGWYVQAAYFLIPEKLQIIGKYETFDPSTRSSDNETKNWIAGFSWFFKGDDLCFRANYYHSDVPLLDAQDKLLLRMQVIF